MTYSAVRSIVQFGGADVGELALDSRHGVDLVGRSCGIV